jgi:hypothetical protein
MDEVTFAGRSLQTGQIRNLNLAFLIMHVASLLQRAGRDCDASPIA